MGEKKPEELKKKWALERKIGENGTKKFQNFEFFGKWKGNKEREVPPKKDNEYQYIIIKV